MSLFSRARQMLFGIGRTSGQHQAEASVFDSTSGRQLPVSEVIDDPNAPAKDRALAFRARGHAWLEKSDYDRAIEDFTQAVRIAPDALIHYNSRGRAYALKGELDSSLSDFDHVIARCMQDADAKLRCRHDCFEALECAGDVYRLKGEVARADASYHDAISQYCMNMSPLIHPDCRRVALKRGRQLREIGEINRALDYFSSLISSHPGTHPKFGDLNAEALYERGLTYLETHYLADAATNASMDFTSAIGANPQYADAYVGRARARVAAVRREIGAGRAGAEDSPNRDYLRVIVMRALGDLDTSIELAPGNPAAYVERAEVQFYLNGDQQGHGIPREVVQRAVADCDKAIELDPKCKRAYEVREQALRCQIGT
ncbi:MAG: tetratricopeptide repeat protein [Anaerolineae bacterium]|nr:tetratricopeptide repeat protein [Anaerolineae bacterium]